MASCSTLWKKAGDEPMNMIWSGLWMSLIWLQTASSAEKAP